MSSTYYDLKHIRASLDVFIDSMGFDSILSEKGDIAYSPDIPLDESCYKEVRTVDVLVLIIGGRYGAAASSNKIDDKTFHTRYVSITRKEFDEAISRDIPVYILIDAAVYSEYQTFQRNRDNSSVVYAHVDSVNIFNLIEDIATRPKNNPIKTFEKFADIEIWLREQWSGLFRELLQRMSAQKQLSDLKSQVNDLRNITDTLKSYMESVIRKIDPDQSDSLIESESVRLTNASIRNKISRNDLIKFIAEDSSGPRGVDITSLIDAIKKSKTVRDFISHVKLLLESSGVSDKDVKGITDVIESTPAALSDLNEVREILKLKKLVK